MSLTAYVRVDVPVDLGRDAARDAARSELAKPDYQRDRPGLLERLFGWVLDRLSPLLEGGPALPGGWVGILLALCLGVLVAVAVARRSPGGRRAAGRALFDGRATTAGGHRAAADAFAARGEWAEAVRERLRAIVRGLEERAVLDPRPGRTADEAAAEAGAALPSCAAQLHDAAKIFDEVWYGGRAATREHDAALQAVDATVQAARPTAAAR